MKKLMAVFILGVMIMLAGCNGGAKENVTESFAQDFYEQMMTDGTQSKEVSAMHEDMTANYSADSDLYKALNAMYEGLADGNAEGHRQEVAKILGN